MTQTVPLFETDVYLQAKNQVVTPQMTSAQTKKAIDDLLAVWTAPLIFEPGGWDEGLPGWMRANVTLARLESTILDGWEIATELETLMYLYTHFLNEPPSHEWGDIYCWLTARCLRYDRREIPEGMKDMVPDELVRDEPRILLDLRRDMRNKQRRSTPKSPNRTTQAEDVQERLL